MEVGGCWVHFFFLLEGKVFAIITWGGEALIAKAPHGILEKILIPWYRSTLSKDCKFNIQQLDLSSGNESEFRTFLLCPTSNSLTSIQLSFIVVNRQQLHQLTYHPPIFLYFYHLCFKNEPSQHEWCLKTNFPWLRCGVNYCRFLQWSILTPTCRELCKVSKCSCLCLIVSRQNFPYQAIFLCKETSEWKNCLQMDKVLRQRQCFDGDRVVVTGSLRRSFRSWTHFSSGFSWTTPYQSVPEMLLSSLAVLLEIALCFTLGVRWLATMLLHEHGN